MELYYVISILDRNRADKMVANGHRLKFRYSVCMFSSSSNFAHLPTILNRFRKKSRVKINKKLNFYCGRV